MTWEALLGRPENEEREGSGHEGGSQHADHADGVLREEGIYRVVIGGENQRGKKIHIENMEQSGQAHRSIPKYKKPQY